MKSIDLLMVFPSGGDVFHTHYKHHLGSGYIIAYLRNHGFRAEQFISNEPSNVEDCVRKIMSYNPKIVGFTVYESNFMQCVLISNGIKLYNSKIITIFGGPTPTIQHNEILESIPSVDLCVRQEGEETVLELLLILSKNKFNLIQTEFHGIKGITYRDKSKIVINPDCNVLFLSRRIKNYLDKYPSPYITGIIPSSEAFHTGIITARGCNQNCNYCNCAVLNKRNIYFHSEERVIEELRLINEQKKFIAPIPIFDDTFTIVPSRAKRICEAIIENKFKIPLLGCTRADKITEELIDLMKQAGFVSLAFSLESAVPRILRAIGKVNIPEITHSGNFDKEIEFIEKLKNMTSYAKKIGIEKVIVSIMIGLPGETLQDAQKTLDLIKKLDIDIYTHNIFHIFKGTPIYEYHKKYGYEINSIGGKNKIFLVNNHPFDVYRIHLAPKCSKIQNSKVIDYDTLKILSLNPKRNDKKSYFNNVIINSDMIKPSLVKWIQQNLAINGVIIQLYSDKKNYQRFYEKNEITLFNEFSPTKFYQCYYPEILDGGSVLKSGRKFLYNEEIGIPIELKNTYSALTQYREGHAKMIYSLCEENSENDSEALFKFLGEISKSEDSTDYLMERPPLPRFQTLCRWTNNRANCRTLETAIIGQDDLIRICWYSDPIGTIGDPFSDIIRTLQYLKIDLEINRNCAACKVEENCMKCLYPFPLSSIKYCHLKNSYDTIKPTNLINAFSLLNDFLFKPINPYDF
ncbi:MAG: B12-binding domain-containing radical SAM protein [Candidatus Thorarchaeota archaeon]